MQTLDLVEAFRRLAEQPGSSDLRADFSERHQDDNPPTIMWRLCGGAPRYVIEKFRVLASRAGDMLAGVSGLCSDETRAIADPLSRWLGFLREACPEAVYNFPEAHEYDASGKPIAMALLGNIGRVVRESELAAERVSGLTEPPEPTMERAALFTEKPPKKPREIRKKKWDHVWELIEKHGATKGTGKNQTIANDHNKVCAARIEAGACERIDAKKVADIRYEHTHQDRHRKQNHRKRP